MECGRTKHLVKERFFRENHIGGKLNIYLYINADRRGAKCRIVFQNTKVYQFAIFMRFRCLCHETYFTVVSPTLSVHQYCQSRVP